MTPLRASGGSASPKAAMRSVSYCAATVDGWVEQFCVTPGVIAEFFLPLVRSSADVHGGRTLSGSISPDRARGAARPERRAHLTLRWRCGALTELDLSLPHSQPRGIRTDEDTISLLLRRLAVHYSDDVIAGILNRQGRKTATGERFTANQVGGLRRYRNIPCCEPPAELPTGDLVTLKDAAKILGVAASTIHRWINDGFVAGEQITPGAPWRIRMSDELRARFVEETPPQFLPMLETTMKLGVSRQTVLQRVKHGDLEAVHVRCGRRKGLRIKVVDTQPGLFQHSS
jgi:predicted DNA-binding transcriptional regulator AlpA